MTKVQQTVIFFLLIVSFGLPCQLFANFSSNAANGDNKIEKSQQKNQGEISGKILEKGTDAPISDVLVILQRDTYTSEVITDANGLFTIKPLDGGTYQIYVFAEGYREYIIPNYFLKEGQVQFLDIILEKLDVDLPEFMVVEYTFPLLEPTATHVGGDFTDKDLKEMRLKDVKDIASLTAGVFQNRDGQIQIRGGRVGTTAFYVDNVRVRSLQGIPTIAIEQMQVITGGIPAKYGDLTSGVVIVTTKSYGDW